MAQRRSVNMRLTLAGVLLAAWLPVHAESESLINGSLQYQSNVPNALDKENVFSDMVAGVRYSYQRDRVVSPGNYIFSGVVLDARKFRDTEGLDSIAAGFLLGYSHRAGLGAYAPRIRMELSAERLTFRKSLRNSWKTVGEIGIEKRLTPEWVIGGSLGYERRDAKSRSELKYNPNYDADVFDQESGFAFARVDYTFENASVLSAGYRYRDGDIDASARPGSALLGITSAIAKDTGIGRNYVAYRIDIRSHAIRLDWSVPLGRDASVTLGVQRSIARAAGGTQYHNNSAVLETSLRF